MLHSISWDSFFEAVLLIAASYYVVSTLLLFHNEIGRWIKVKVRPADLSHISRQEVPTPQSTILGGVNPLEGATTNSSVIVEDIAVATEDETQEVIQSLSPEMDKQLLVGSVADLLEEVKTLVQLVSEYKSTKGESRELFRSLFIRYPHVKETSFRDAINLYLCEAAKNQFAFDLSVEDITSWWTIDPSFSNSSEQ